VLCLGEDAGPGVEKCGSGCYSARYVLSPVSSAGEGADVGQYLRPYCLSRAEG
jgi:hypothetical protein